MKSKSNTPSRLERREIPAFPKTERGLRSIPAWLISLVFHVTAIAVVGVLWVGKPNGTGAEKDRPIGVAVVYETSGGEEYFLNDSGSKGGASSLNSAEAAEQALPDAELDSSSEFATEALLAEMLPGASNAGGAASTAAGGLGMDGGGADLGGSRGVPKVKTTVFGIEGEGTRFLYVFDRSDSMNGYGGRPFKAAKAELLKSIDSLGEAHQFQIIFYNDTPLPYGGVGGGAPALLTGEKRPKADAARFVRDVVAVGGTRHLEALRMAIRMAPDVIFFLTDADTAPSAREIENLKERAGRIGATIHAIQFGAGPNQRSNGWSKLLAAGTAGQFRYVDVTQLSD